MRPPKSNGRRGIRGGRKIWQEMIQDTSDAGLQVLKQLYDRRPLCQRYVTGEVAVHVHVNFPPVGQYCASYLTASLSRERARRPLLPEHLAADLDRRDEPLFVFVSVGDLAQPSGPAASAVRLIGLKACHVFDADSFEKGRAPSLPTVCRLLNSKLRAGLPRSGVEPRHLEDQIVQGASLVVDDLPGYDAPNCGDRDWRLVRDQLIRVRVKIKGDFLTCFCEEGIDPRFEIRQMMACPTDAEIRRRERMIDRPGGHD